MRLIHVVPTYAPAWRYGGPIRSVHGLCRALAARGHEVHVFTTSVDGPGDLDVPIGRAVDLDGVSVTYFASRHLRRLYWSSGMGRALEQFVPSCDVVHLHSVFLWPTWAAAQAARRHRVPYGISPRGMLVPDLVRRKSRLAKSAWIALIERRNIEAAAFLHVTSALEAHEAGRFGMRLPELAVIPNGVGGEFGEEDASALPELLADAPFLLFVGRVNWKKGLDRLIPALASVPEANLVVAGNDEEEYVPALQAIASKAGVAGRVRFVGEVRGWAKAELMRRAALLVLPSYSENFGNVVLEAMAEGCPVAVTAGVGLAPTVAAAGAGVVLPDEPAGMGAMIASLLADDKRRHEMGARGRKLVEERFSWDAVAAGMEAVYERLAGKEKPHG